MGRYDFVSPGAMGNDAIQKFLVQRAMEQRQAQLDALAKEEQTAQLAQQAEHLKLQQAQEKRLAEQQKTQQEDLRGQREFAKATTIANSALPGDPVDAPTRELLGRQGYGGQITPGIVAQGPLLGNDEQDIPQYGVMHQPDTMRGGSQYLSARAAEDARAAQAAETQAARATELAGQREFTAGQNELGRENTRAIAASNRGNQSERLVQIMGPAGTPIWVKESDAVGKPAAQAARAVTGQERQALAYFNRAQQATKDIETPDTKGTSLEDRVSKAGLGTQVGLQYAPNMLQTQDQQAYRQAQRAFTEARLRKESGAAIPANEYANDARTYFAQPGDDPATIEQKRKARAVVLEGLKFGSGKAYDEFYGAAPKGSTSGTDGEGWTDLGNGIRARKKR